MGGCLWHVLYNGLDCACGRLAVFLALYALRLLFFNHYNQYIFNRNCLFAHRFGVVLVLMMFQFSPATSIKKTRTLENGGNLTEVLPVTTDKKDSVLVAYGEPLNAQKLGEFNENRKAMRVSAADRVLCLGVPGSGKTAYLVAQIIDWMSTGQSLVVTDIKPEIWARLHENGIFKKFGYKVYVFNPTNPEAHKYNLFDEFSTVAELSEIMEVVIPQAQGEGEQFNKTLGAY